MQPGDLPLIGRSRELTLLTELLRPTGGDVAETSAFVLGEPGIGKTRLLNEVTDRARLRGLTVLRGRAIEHGGSFRPLVEAFSRVSSDQTDGDRLGEPRARLEAMFGDSASGSHVLGPLTNPAVAIGEALLALVQKIAPAGALLAVDDVQWADDDTISVLHYLLDSTPATHLCLVMAARDGPDLSERQERLVQRVRHRLWLRRLPTEEVERALEGLLPRQDEHVRTQIATAGEGLPLVLDEFVAVVQQQDLPVASLLRSGGLASVVHARIAALAVRDRATLLALAVVEEAMPDLLSAAGDVSLEDASRALREGVRLWLLVAGEGTEGHNWRHSLIKEAVLSVSSAAERRRAAARAAHFLLEKPVPSSDDLRRAASFFFQAGDGAAAAATYLRSARAAMRQGALRAAEADVSTAMSIPAGVAAASAASTLLVEQLKLMTLTDRAGEAYSKALAATKGAVDVDESEQFALVAAQAALVADRSADAQELVATVPGPDARDRPAWLLVRAQIAMVLSQHAPAEALAARAARIAATSGDPAQTCDAWVLVGRAQLELGRPHAARSFLKALRTARAHSLIVWELRALAELGTVDLITCSDERRFVEAGQLAMDSGMVGMQALLDMQIGGCVAMRDGFVAAYPHMYRAADRAQALRLTGLHAAGLAHLAECAAFCDVSTMKEVATRFDTGGLDDLVDVSVELGNRSKSVEWARCALGLRACLQGDDLLAISHLESGLAPLRRPALKIPPWWGVLTLLRVVHGLDAQAALDELAEHGRTGHFANWAALSYARALTALPDLEAFAQHVSDGNAHVRQAPFARHLLRTIMAPAVARASVPLVEGWLREADAFCARSGERALQQRIRRQLAAIGVALPRQRSGEVPVALSALGITGREAEVLGAINQRVSNAALADQLSLSVRTVESHVRSLLRKTGTRNRDELRRFASDPRTTRSTSERPAGAI